jgi:hypothetical protein
LHGDHLFRGCGFGGCGLDTRGYFLLCLSSGRLSGCCRFLLGRLRSTIFLVSVILGVRRRLRDLLRRGFRVWWWNVGGLDNTHPLYDVIPFIAQIRLFGRGPGPLGFRSSGVPCCGALSTTPWPSLRDGRIRFFPLYTAPVIHYEVFPAATALRLLPRRWAPTGEVGATIRDAPGRISAGTLCMSEELAALALQWAFWRHL